jgi:hypothetical protein
VHHLGKVARCQSLRGFESLRLRKVCYNASVMLEKEVNTKNFIPNITKLLEGVLAVMVIVGVVVYIYVSINYFANADWSNTETLYLLIKDVLAVVIGIELVRMLVTHNFISILELLAFVVARKMLDPDITTFDAFLGVTSFVILIGAYFYLIVPNKDCKFE